MEKGIRDGAYASDLDTVWTVLQRTEDGRDPFWGRWNRQPHVAHFKCEQLCSMRVQAGKQNFCQAVQEWEYNMQNQLQRRRRAQTGSGKAGVCPFSPAAFHTPCPQDRGRRERGDGTSPGSEAGWWELGCGDGAAPGWGSRGHSRGVATAR